MNKRRLGAIARWLEKGAPEKDGMGFNMSDFFGGFRMDIAYQLRNEVGIVEMEKQLKSCGTTCCIAGAAIAFYDDGLRS